MKLSVNRLYRNQRLIKLIDGKRIGCTRHTYESVKAIYDVDILDNGELHYGKNCSVLYNDLESIPIQDRPYYDFIMAAIES